MSIRNGFTALILLLALLFPLAAAAFGEDGAEPPPPKKPGKDRRANRGRDKQFKKLAQELGLSEEQMAKIRELKMAEAQKMKEFRDAQQAKIKELLTPEQMTKYEDLRKRMSKRMGKDSRGGRGGREGGRGGKGSRRGGRANPLEALKHIGRELGLSEEQQAKIKELGKQMQKAALEVVDEARASGDYSKVKPKIEALQKRLVQQARDLLSPEQKAKFDAFLRGGKEALRRMGEGRGQGRRRNPKETMEMQIKKIQKSLDLLPEEAMIIMPKVEEILKAHYAVVAILGDQKKQVNELLKSGDVSDDAIEKELANLRNLRQLHKDKVEKMRESLRELLTLKQEAQLVLAGVLD